MFRLHFARLSLPLSFVLAAPALACGGSVASPGQVVSADSAATRAPVAQGAQGPIKRLGEALSDVPLTPAQRVEIEKLAADAGARHAIVRSARSDLALALAAQVQAGSVDRAALQPKIDALVAALQKTQPQDRAAFEQLHAILGSDQRVAFVDALEARTHEHFGHMFSSKHHPMKQWADDLKLTDDQRTQIRSILKERFASSHATHEEAPWKAGMQRGAKVLGAFKQDHFVMDEVAPGGDVAQRTAKMSDRILGLVEQVLPILTPEQRTLAAQKIRERAGSVLF